MLRAASIMRRIMSGLVALLFSSVAWADPLRGGASAPMTEAASWLPSFLRPLAAALVPIQRDLVTSLQHHMGQIRDGDAPMAALAIIGIGLVYGVVHAAGPGHGKVVVGSYFSTRKASIAQALAASGAIALVQALSAIGLVALFTLVMGWGSRTLLDNAGWFDVASFGMIAAFGVSLVWRALRGGGGECCPHHHHDDRCGHPSHDPSRRDLLLGALAVGMRPCSGALLILLFTFTNHLYAVGVLAPLAMAVGTAVTVAAVGLGAMGLRSLVERGTGGALSRKTASLAGGVIITVLGLAMAAAALATVS
jgi:nickel/cobalt transporter (NicO) family protein